MPPSSSVIGRPVVLDRQPVAVCGDQSRPGLVHGLRRGGAHCSSRERLIVLALFASLIPAGSFHAKHAVDALHHVEVGKRRNGFRQRGVGGPVGDDDDARAAPLTALVDHALLADLGDADLALAEFGCHRGQHAGPVGDVHVDVVAGGDEADRRDRQLGVLGLARAAATLHPVAGGHHQIAHHRRRGRCAACALAVEHQPARRLGLDNDGVERTADGRQRMLKRHQRRIYPCRNPLLAFIGGEAFADRQQLDRAAQRPGRREVGRGDLGDALAVDVVGGDAGVERDRGQDRGLGRGVIALDVGGRVGLGIAERAGIGQCRCVVGACARPSPRG